MFISIACVYDRRRTTQLQETFAFNLNCTVNRGFLRGQRALAEADRDSAVATFRETLVAGGYVAEVRKPTAKHYRPSLSDHCPTETVRPLSHQSYRKLRPYTRRETWHFTEQIQFVKTHQSVCLTRLVLCFAFALVRMTPR